MRKLLFVLLTVLSFSSYGQVKIYALQATKNLQADLNFTWQGTVIKKDSLAYFEQTADSIRFRRINGTWGAWYQRVIGAGFYANNGLTKVTGDTVQIGGALTKNTAISSGAYTLGISGSKSGNIFSVTNANFTAIYGSSQNGQGVSGYSANNYPVYGTGGSYGVVGQADGGTAVAGLSLTGVGLFGNTYGGLPISAWDDNAIGNTVTPLLRLSKTSSGTVGTGLGGSIEYYAEEIGTWGSLLTNRLISKWIDANHATRTSQLSFTGVKNGTESTLITISPDSITLPIGTANKWLSLDVNKNITYNDAPASAKELNTIYATGLIKGGILTINTDSTKFNISAGEGYIVDNHTDAANPIKTKITWATQSGIIDSHISSSARTYIKINSSGNIIQTTSAFTIEEARDYIFIGRTVHPNLSKITNITNEPWIIYNSALSSYDIVKSLGAINTSGNVYTYNGTNLNINKSSGSTYSVGRNYAFNNKIPNITTDLSGTAISFRYRYRNGSGGFTNTALTTNVDPNNYDTGTGTLIAVGNNKWTIQRIYYFIFPNTLGNTYITYGQTEYASYKDAKDGIYTEHPVLDPALMDASLRGYLIVLKGTTNLSNVSENIFIQASKFGEPMGSGGIGGDVIGPASATNTAIARFDGTTGKYLKDGANATIDDSGNAAFAGSVTATGFYLSANNSINTDGSSLYLKSGGTIYADKSVNVTGAGVFSGSVTATGGSSTDWNTSYTDRLKWDGGSTGLTASTGRTSLGLGGLSTVNITVQSLSGITPSWNVSSGINATLTLSGNTTITLSNLVAGTSGNLTVTNPAALYTLSLSGYTNKISPSAYTAANQLTVSGGSKIDVFSWYYDGTNLLWNGSNDYK